MLFRVSKASCALCCAPVLAFRPHNGALEITRPPLLPSPRFLARMSPWGRALPKWLAPLWVILAATLESPCWVRCHQHSRWHFCLCLAGWDYLVSRCRVPCHAPLGWSLVPSPASALVVSSTPFSFQRLQYAHIENPMSTHRLIIPAMHECITMALPRYDWHDDCTRVRLGRG